MSESSCHICQSGKCPSHMSARFACTQCRASTHCPFHSHNCSCGHPNCHNCGHPNCRYCGMKNYITAPIQLYEGFSVQDYSRTTYAFVLIVILLIIYWYNK